MAFEVITQSVPAEPSAAPWVDTTSIATKFYVRMSDGTLREVISSTQINNIIVLTEAQYSALGTKEPGTLYLRGVPVVNPDGTVAWNLLTDNDIGTTERITGVHAGTFGDESLTDDYRYTCVLSGIAETTEGAGDGTAKWKKQPLFQSI